MGLGKFGWLSAIGFGILFALLVIWCFDPMVQHEYEAVHEKGRKASIMGVPDTACPYNNDSINRKKWLEGWIKGYEEKRNK